MKTTNWIWMVIGCGLPLLLIFLAPSFGIEGGSSLFTFIIIMFAVHLFIPHGSHGGNTHSQHKQKEHEHNKEIPSVESKEEHKGHQHH